MRKGIKQEAGQIPVDHYVDYTVAPSRFNTWKDTIGHSNFRYRDELVSWKPERGLFGLARIKVCE